MLQDSRIITMLSIRQCAYMYSMRFNVDDSHWNPERGSFFFNFFSPSHEPGCFFFFAFLFSLPLSRDSDPASHDRLFFPPPTAVRALRFYREKISALPSSTRVD